ncbi:MAG: DUF1049 domain-containing protein [Peptococcaceae bacterium]|nr:DUF1049 domain-containing protein [Peptococcaceae bacterium]
MFVLLLSIVIALIIVIFAVQNALTVPIQFFFWSAQLPLVLVIFCSVLAGALLMFCLALWRDLKSQMKKRPLKGVKTEKQEKENQKQNQNQIQNQKREPSEAGDINPAEDSETTNQNNQNNQDNTEKISSNE